ncbi:MAG: hypothetical protein RLZZ449_1036 [Actinomycetota bacterium]
MRRCLVASIASIIAVVGVVAPASAATNDTYNSQQWGLSSTGAMAVWSTTRGAGVIVAIVDSGTGPHPDLDANIDPGMAISGGVEQTDATDVDNEGHGTHVSGIVAALADNALGVAGVAPAARILPIRVLDANGSGDSRDVARGIRLAADRGARVVNLSLGGATESSAVTQAIDYAISKGALVVAAAGNGGSLSTPKWPASYDATIAVTSVDPDDQSPAFAQRGDYIDIAAPGVRILSTAKGEYNLQSGTSMSAAFVSGAAALLFSARPQLTPAEVREMLILSAVDIGAPGRDATYGAGRLNVPGAFAILNARYPSTAAISINGLARVGTTLTALSASSPSTVQWYRCQQIGTDSVQGDVHRHAQDVACRRNDQWPSAVLGNTGQSHRHLVARRKVDGRRASQALDLARQPIHRRPFDSSAQRELLDSQSHGRRLHTGNLPHQSVDRGQEPIPRARHDLRRLDQLDTVP